MAITPLAWLMQALPEALAIAALALALSNNRLRLSSIFLIGIPFSIAVYLIRLTPLIFGVHFIILIVILAILLNVRLKERRFSQCLLVALISCLILAITETVFVYLLTLWTGVSFEQVDQGDALLRVLFSYPHIVFLVLLALAVNRWKKSSSVRREERHV